MLARNVCAGKPAPGLPPSSCSSFRGVQLKWLLLGPMLLCHRWHLRALGGKEGSVYSPASVVCGRSIWSVWSGASGNIVSVSSGSSGRNAGWLHLPCFQHNLIKVGRQKRLSARWRRAAEDGPSPSSGQTELWTLLGLAQVSRVRRCFPRPSRPARSLLRASVFSENTASVEWSPGPGHHRPLHVEGTRPYIHQVHGLRDPLRKISLCRCSMSIRGAVGTTHLRFHDFCKET